MLFEQESENILTSESFEAFFRDNKEWLIPYAAYSYLRDLYAAYSYLRDLNHTSDFNNWGEYSRYDKEHIGDIRDYQLFVVHLLHISRPLSIFFTLSRAALSCFALSFAAARALRIEGFLSLFSFFAENS